jgi:mRNA interferase MazF
MHRGDIWWGEQPDHKGRPYLVLTRDAAIPVLRSVIVAPLTSTSRGIPTEVELDQSDGVPEPCVVALDSVVTISRALLTRRLGSVSSERMSHVCAALAIAVDC